MAPSLCDHVAGHEHVGTEPSVDGQRHRLVIERFHVTLIRRPTRDRPAEALVRTTELSAQKMSLDYRRCASQAAFSIVT